MLSSVRLAEAHELSMNTARVSLRDAHLEVMAEIDPLSFLEHLQADPQGKAVEIAALDEPELSALLARAAQVLETQTRIEADGERLGVELRLSLDPKEIRELVHASPEARHERAHLVPVQWEAKEALLSAKRITVVFPASLGPVLITFVQPSTRWTAPGASAVFSVLGRPESTPSEAPTRSRWGEGAVLLAVVAILLNVGLSRRRRNAMAPAALEADRPPLT